MKNKHNNFLSWISLFFLMTIACNLSSGPTATQPPATQSPVDILAVDTPLASTAPVVQHVMTPPAELPSMRSGLAGDYDSSTTAPENRAPSGDRFTFGRFERPFNSNAMDVYYPNIDIQNTLFYQDDTWIYGVMSLKEYASSKNVVAKYAIEIDLNVDGGGDWLILALQPTSTEWTADGAQVWFDTNDDVGGSLRELTDKEPVTEDGYETQVFGNGQGDDPDLAWVRISPNDPNSVEIAAKKSLLGGDNTYLVGMWAGGDSLTPALFDLNDLFTHEQAGTSLKELEFYYPIKEVSELDNSCRMAIGFEPIGNEPGLCEKLVPVRPGETPPTGCQLNDAICANIGPGYYFDAPNCVCNYFG